jgi:hypothetical protein
MKYVEVIENDSRKWNGKVKHETSFSTEETGICIAEAYLCLFWFIAFLSVQYQVERLRAFLLPHFLPAHYLNFSWEVSDWLVQHIHWGGGQNCIRLSDQIAFIHPRCVFHNEYRIIKTSNTTCFFVKGVIINKTTTCFGYFVSPSSGCLPFLICLYMQPVFCVTFEISRESVVWSVLYLVLIFSGSDPVWLPPIPWTEKNNLKGSKSG